MKIIFSLLCTCFCIALHSCQITSRVKAPIVWSKKADRFRHKESTSLDFVVDFVKQKDMGCVSSDTLYYRKTGALFSQAAYDKTKAIWHIKITKSKPTTKNSTAF